MTVPVLRFAPSPNGRLHLGHAYSALLNAEFAARWGGRLLVRIEDIDPGRSRPDFEAASLEDLAWLGLRWEEPVRRQSEHMAVYAEALRRLGDAGLAYPCVCSRAEVARASPGSDPDGAPLYGGTCRTRPAAELAGRIADGARAAMRLDSARAAATVGGPLAWDRFDREGGVARVAAEPARWGDAVIGRRDVPTSYHLAVVLDDALQGVTHVVRGQDLEAATDLHVLLQRLLGLPTPAYHHHGLVRDEAGDKLAKSRGSPALADLRAAGVTAPEIRRRLGFGT